MQLAGIVVPQVAKMQKEESGRKKINQYTRYLTVLVTAFQASAYVAFLRSPQYPGCTVLLTIQSIPVQADYGCRAYCRYAVRYVAG